MTTSTNFLGVEQHGLTQDYHKSSVDLVVTVYQRVALDREIRPEIILVHLRQRFTSEGLEHLQMGACGVHKHRACRKRQENTHGSA